MKNPTKLKLEESISHSTLHYNFLKPRNLTVEMYKKFYTYVYIYIYIFYTTLKVLSILQNCVKAFAKTHVKKLKWKQEVISYL